ncbi:hypothetical protein HYW73_03830 [Candidatus Nomurabacteria bacterium]|nr:hypothetical protein [Candidatus Nomurabacteria bacterium]
MEPEQKSNGALIGSIIIIIILIAGGIYIWQSKVEEQPLPEGTLEGEVVSPADEDELNSLELDVNSANSDIEANAINSVE